MNLKCGLILISKILVYVKGPSSYTSYSYSPTKLCGCFYLPGGIMPGGPVKTKDQTITKPETYIDIVSNKDGQLTGCAY